MIKQQEGGRMLNRWLRTTSPALLMVPVLWVGSDAVMPQGESDEVELPGAIDPSLPGQLGPATNEVISGNSLNAAVGSNVLVNSRDLCASGRGLIQSETSVAVNSNGVAVAAFNDSRGVCDPDNHAAVGWAFTFDYGNTWTDGGGLPNSRQLNNGDPWLAVSPDGSTF